MSSVPNVPATSKLSRAQCIVANVTIPTPTAVASHSTLLATTTPTSVECATMVAATVWDDDLSPLTTQSGMLQHNDDTHSLKHNGDNRTHDGDNIGNTGCTFNTVTLPVKKIAPIT